MTYNIEEMQLWVFAHNVFNKLTKSVFVDTQYHFEKLHKFNFNFISFTRNL